jgi:hypothetical protein
VYPLPIGRGKKLFSNMNRAVNYLVGGWQMNGFTRWTTGSPFTISSGRVTTGSQLTSTAMLRNMMANQLQKYIGVFRGPNGVYFINPDSGLMKINGASSTAVACAPGQTTPCFDFPAPGQLGNTGYNYFQGPRYLGQDAGLAKHTKIRERLDIELRCEMFNVFNNVNFVGAQTNITGATFGQLTAQLDTSRGGGALARSGQWAIRVSF